MSKMPKEKIDVLVISDIHLGDRIVRCKELLGILRSYDAKKIVLNGDILNGLKFQRLHSDHWRVLSAFRDLSRTREVIWVQGNHDADIGIISRLLGIRTTKKHAWEVGGISYLAIHGHQFDRFLNNNFLVSQATFFLYGQMKRFALGRFLLDYLKDNNETWRRNSEGVARGAMRLASVTGTDVVICGHTHQILEKEKDGVRYFNTGSWTEAPSGYLVIKDGQVVLRKIE